VNSSINGAGSHMIRFLNQNKGFTLIEMVVAMGIFIVVIMITANSFEIILRNTAKFMKSEESNIEGVIALEILRHDLEQAGYGLPYTFQAVAPIYNEAGYAPANLLNDAPGGVPRAFASRNNLVAGDQGTTVASGGVFNFVAGADYLSIKGVSFGLNALSQRWSYATYSSSTTGSKPPRIWKSDNLQNGDRVIVIRRRFSDSTYANQLSYNTGTPAVYWAEFNASTGLPAGFSPLTPEENVYIYGVANVDLGMPFNRTDYFVGTPSDTTKIPSFCAAGSGILYKATVYHTSSNPGGKLNYLPLLDCIADMQVIYHWDLADSSGTIVTDQDSIGDGSVDTQSNADGSVVSGIASVADVQAVLANAAHIRTKLKKIEIHILAQDGQRDQNYTSPSSFPMGGSLGRIYTLTAAMANYHWKIYRINVIPKNLAANQ